MSYSNNPRDWSDERIVAFLKNYWKCDNFIFLSTIVKEPYKTKNPEKYKGSIRDLICGGKVLSYPNSIPPIFFNISATTNFKVAEPISILAIISLIVYIPPYLNKIIL